MNRLIILQENLEFTRKVWNYLMAKEAKLHLSSLAVNSQEAMARVSDLDQEDILVLDFEIESEDAFEVFRNMKRRKKPLPYIIAISGQGKLVNRLKRYSTYFYETLYKPFPFNSIIHTIEKIIYETMPRTKEDMIKGELRKFDIDVTTKGYKYIAEAILLSLENEILLKDMTHGLYQVMAEKREGINGDNVKWTIEKMVRSIKRFTSTKLIKSYFYVVEVEEVTPKRFIATIAERIRDKIEYEKEQKML
ncbi:MAG: hypothetical protein HFJ26_07755 [Clostridia bacterium]|nr:hypothetical protein [Clostridia bacterium]